MKKFKLLPHRRWSKFLQFGFTVIKTENFAVLVLMVAYSLAKAKEGVRISYTALYNLEKWAWR